VHARGHGGLLRPFRRAALRGRRCGCLPTHRWGGRHGGRRPATCRVTPSL
ncbi:MAG: hypothetical protein AVDCRST_MAG17-373, partial [uncultured Solirubrobacterales bacterium]